MTFRNKESMAPSDLLARFEAMEAVIPRDREEFGDFFSEIGVDRDAALRSVLSAAKHLDDELRQSEYRVAGQERARVLARLASGRVTESRAELLARIDAMRHRMPDVATLYKDLTDVPDEDLATLISELEYLDRSDEDE